MFSIFSPKNNLIVVPPDAKKENSPRTNTSGKSGNTSGSGNETTKRRRQRPHPVMSSSSSDEAEPSSAKTKSRPARRNSKDNLLNEFRSNTIGRSHKFSPKQPSLLAKQTKHKSSESILDDQHSKIKFEKNRKEILSDNDILNDNFDFTSTRLKRENNKTSKTGPFDFLLNKPPNLMIDATGEAGVVVIEEEAKKSDTSDSKHEPFGSTEFPTMKRNLKLPTQPIVPISVAENEYESMTSLDVRDSIDHSQTIRVSVWTPPGENPGAKTVDGLSSPSVITTAQDDVSKKQVEGPTNEAMPIEPPPNFGSEKPPPLPVKKFGKHQQSRSKSQTKDHPNLVIQPSQVRMASKQAVHEREHQIQKEQQRQQQQRNKRIRNRSLEMVLDSEPRSSDSSPSRHRCLHYYFDRNYWCTINYFNLFTCSYFNLM